MSSLLLVGGGRHSGQPQIKTLGTSQFRRIEDRSRIVSTGVHAGKCPGTLMQKEERKQKCSEGSAERVVQKSGFVTPYMNFIETFAQFLPASL